MQQESYIPLLEKQWTKEQVENHLIFQFFAKSIPFSWVMLLVVAALLAFGITTNRGWPFLGLSIIGPAQGFIYLNKQPLFKQAVLGWLFTKVSITLLCIVMVGVVVSVNAGMHGKGLIYILLAVLWFPSIEFLPGLAANQKYITAIRIILTVLIPYFVTHGNY